MPCLYFPNINKSEFIYLNKSVFSKGCSELKMVKLLSRLLNFFNNLRKSIFQKKKKQTDKVVSIHPTQSNEDSEKLFSKTTISPLFTRYSPKTAESSSSFDIGCYDLIVRSSDWNRSNCNEFNIYHYTSKIRAKLILKSQIIKPYKARIPPFKKAVYLTMLPPFEGNNKLIRNNYKGNIKYITKIQCAFAFDNRSLQANRYPLKKNDSRDVWCTDAPINLRLFNFRLILRNEK